MARGHRRCAACRPWSGASRASCGTTFPIGLVFRAIIDFLAVAVILFFIVKAYNRWKANEPAAPPEVDLLTEIRDTLQQQQRN